MKNIVREVTLCPSDGAQGVVQKKTKIYIQINFLWFSGFCVEVDVFFFYQNKDNWYKSGEFGRYVKLHIAMKLKFNEGPSWS
jgi:hypothetical protein